MGKSITENDIETIKLLTSKGLSKKQIENVTKRSYPTIVKVQNGEFDNKFNKVSPPTNDLRNLITQALDILAKIEEKL